MGFFDKIKQSLTKTTRQFVERFDEAVRLGDSADQRTRPIDVDTVEALEEALISADVGVAATERIIEAIRARRTRDRSLRELVKEGELQVDLNNDVVGPTCLTHDGEIRHAATRERVVSLQSAPAAAGAGSGPHVPPSEKRR